MAHVSIKRIKILYSDECYLSETMKHQLQTERDFMAFGASLAYRRILVHDLNVCFDVVDDIQNKAKRKAYRRFVIIRFGRAHVSRYSVQLIQPW